MTLVLAFFVWTKFQTWPSSQPIVYLYELFANKKQRNEETCAGRRGVLYYTQDSVLEKA